MAKAIQKRTLQTRAKLVQEAKALIREKGYEGLRIDDLVKRAGVAKGTFFAHFKDKDTLMAFLIGAEIERCLDQIETLQTPSNVEDLIKALSALIALMTQERYVFDIIMRYCGARALDDVGPIAQSFLRQVLVLSRLIENGPFRNDIPNILIAEGIQAFALQAMSLKFCALHKDEKTPELLKTYLKAWLMPYALS